VSDTPQTWFSGSAKIFSFNAPGTGQSNEIGYTIHLNFATKTTSSENLHFLIDQSFHQSHHMLSFVD